MKVSIESMTMDHYDEVIALWKKSGNVGLSKADERESIRLYLERNPEMSFVAKENDHIVGASLCGHDGRRGYLHHLAVKETHRKRGIGTKLVDRCMEALRKDGIQKCHLFVFQTNKEGKSFWRRIGWLLRSDIHVVSREL